jgi:hypothetical protein
MPIWCFVGQSHSAYALFEATERDPRPEMDADIHIRDGSLFQENAAAKVGLQGL